MSIFPRLPLCTVLRTMARVHRPFPIMAVATKILFNVLEKRLVSTLIETLLYPNAGSSPRCSSLNRKQHGIATGCMMKKLDKSSLDRFSNVFHWQFLLKKNKNWSGPLCISRSTKRTSRYHLCSTLFLQRILIFSAQLMLCVPSGAGLIFLLAKKRSRKRLSIPS